MVGQKYITKTRETGSAIPWFDGMGYDYAQRIIAIRNNERAAEVIGLYQHNQN